MSSEFKERCTWGIVGWVAIVLITFSIAGLVRAGWGRDIENHYGPIPAGVTQLTQRDYLVGKTAAVLPMQLCRGSSGSGSHSVDSSAPVPQLHGASFVVCDAKQSFNDHRPFGKTGWIEIAQAAQRPAFEIGLGVALLLCLLPALTVVPADRRAIKERKRAIEAKNRTAKAKNRKVLTAAESKRAALGASYARDEITTEQLDKALSKLDAELMEQGLSFDG